MNARTRTSAFTSVAPDPHGAVERLRATYLQGQAACDELVLLARALPEWPLAAAQAAVVDGVLACAPAREFPPNSRRTSRFVRLLVRALEDESDVEEIDERLLRMCATLPMTPLVAAPELAYLHFHVGADAAPIVLRAADAWGAGAETGCCVWDAGAWLAFYALARPELFASRCVVELGSGCGLLSCLLARECAASELVATDVYGATVDNLRANLRRNGGADVPVLAAHGVAAHVALRRDQGLPTVCCATLDWTEPTLASATALAAVTPDVVVAADCVYSEELLDGLARTIRALLARPSAIALVASKRRSEETLRAFEAALVRHGLQGIEEAIGPPRAESDSDARERAQLWRLCDPSDVSLLRITPCD
ncbi:hypothetical protein KFE25_009241 [Diacronema lutheri]|uniref:Calmodulin-lysine N-methyltransferase n=1 Tax=Diacronema lutheri TaxID=2081491 RepID=A0A8J5XZG0_DIALT|nr:hypothetical protein KFE25_009241 [Diacronema lutheri]